MTLTGVWLNAGGVLLAGVLGSFIRRGMPEKLKAALMTGLGLCVLYIGISGISADTDTVVLVLSVSLGISPVSEIADSNVSTMVSRSRIGTFSFKSPIRTL